MSGCVSGFYLAIFFGNIFHPQVSSTAYISISSVSTIVARLSPPACVCGRNKFKIMNTGAELGEGLSAVHHCARVSVLLYFLSYGGDPLCVNKGEEDETGLSGCCWCCGSPAPLSPSREGFHSASSCPRPGPVWTCCLLSWFRRRIQLLRLQLFYYFCGKWFPCAQKKVYFLGTLSTTNVLLARLTSPRHT